jgi:nucleoid-associated protein YgaU
MADTPAKDPAGNEKVGPKKGMLTGKNKWYVVGGLGILAVLVFFFVSRSNANAGGTTGGTATTSLDPATQAALQSALQAQAGSGYSGSGATGATGPAGATGPPGPRGKRGPQGKQGPPPPKRPPPHHRSTGSFYIVKPRDTLSSIAAQQGIKGGWHQLYSMNRSVVGSNPNVIHPGQRLRV